MTSTEQISCPVCSTPSGAYCIPIKEFKIYKCANCGLEHTYPIPSLAQLKDFYSVYTDIRAASDVVRLNAKRNLKILEEFGYKESKTLLDFGTGDADFVDIAGNNCFGIDFKSTSKPRVYSNLKDLPIKKYDFITLWAVLEHLDNPKETLSDLSSFAKQNGIIAITTVDAEGVIPYHYKPVEHLTYWTKNSFEKLFKKVGIKLIEYKPYKMLQRSEIYVDRILSRTPTEYKSAFDEGISVLPKYIEIPTNEVLVVGQFLN
jgi:transcription elongation factor Elf1